MCYIDEKINLQNTLFPKISNKETNIIKKKKKVGNKLFDILRLNMYYL